MTHTKIIDDDPSILWDNGLEHMLDHKHEVTRDDDPPILCPNKFEHMLDDT